MKQFLKKSLCAAVVFGGVCSAACVPTHPDYMNRMSGMKGMTKQQLVRAMGMQPTGIYNVNADTQLVVFMQDKIEEVPPSANITFEDPINIQGYDNVPQNLFCKTTFVMQKGVVVDFNYEGNACSYSDME